MAPIIGALLAISVGLFATVVRLDRDRSFYAVVMIVIAALYSLFAVMGASTEVLVRESVIGVGFIAVTTAGFRWSLWLVAAALAAHGVYDLTHGMFFVNAGVPVWWPHFCFTYDVVAAAYLAVLLLSGRIRAAA